MSIPILFPYYGGKMRMRSWIISHFPKHRHYIEPFGGSMAVLLGKIPSHKETYNDLNTDVVNMFRFLRDEDYCLQMKRKLEYMPFSRKEYFETSHTFESLHEGSFERAWKFLYLAMSAFGGSIGNKNKTGMSISFDTETNRGKTSINKVDLIPKVSRRIREVAIESLDAIDLIYRYDNKDVLFYCDPPYHSETRGMHNDYKYTVDLMKLIEILVLVKGKVVLSGYDHSDFNVLLDVGWKKYQKKARMTIRGGDGIDTDRLESLWVSPSANNNEGGLFD